MPSILEAYQHLHPTSARLYAEAMQVFPGGVTHDTRFARPFPLYVRRAEGSRKWDVDGNEIIDFVSGHGSLLLGHCHPAVVEAVREQVGIGTHLGACHELEIEWGHLVQQLIPSAELVRFTSSGTEAVQMAVRLSRAFTGKDKLLKFENHFHGWSDTVSAAAVPEDELPHAPGVPADLLAQQLVLPPNDLDAVEQTLRARNDVAAVILEPTGEHMGKVPVDHDFLRALRDLTRTYGAVLIFDEVVTGFRASPGGVQALCGITPDLTTLAKILAGGLPGGAVAGRAEIMNRIAHSDDADWNKAERVEHHGTFNANPLSAAAGTTCLGLVASGEPGALANIAAQSLAGGMNAVLRRREIPGCVYGTATILHVVLGEECPELADGITWRWPDADRRAVPETSPARRLALKRAMLNEGVDLMGDSRLIVSAAHDPATVQSTLDAFDRALVAMQGEGVV